jgi:HTH-type transcriptional regulator, glycine betaine synthesis regulator
MSKPATATKAIKAAKPSGLVRAEGRAPEVVAFEEALVGFFVEAADLLGAPKSVAAIYAICFASPEPLGFSEINERLEISSGSISQGLRVLREIGALKITHACESSGPSVEPSSRGSDEKSSSRVNDRAGAHFTRNKVPRPTDAKRRDRYTPDLALRKLVLRFIEQRLETQLRSGRERLDALAGAIPPSLKTDAEDLKARLGSLRTWHDRARAVLPLVKTFLKLT